MPPGPVWASRPGEGAHGPRGAAVRCPAQALRHSARLVLVSPAVASPESDAPPPADELARAIDSLVDECRVRCLWFLRRDYYPRTDPERIRVLSAIQERADLAVFRRAGRLKAWLSRTSSAASASS